MWNLISKFRLIALFTVFVNQSLFSQTQVILSTNSHNGTSELNICKQNTQFTWPACWCNDKTFPAYNDDPPFEWQLIKNETLSSGLCECNLNDGSVVLSGTTVYTKTNGPLDKDNPFLHPFGYRGVVSTPKFRQLLIA